MIEIRTNIKGDITVKETEDATGIGTYWIFQDLQDYIINFHPDKDALHHLCLLSLYQMERTQMMDLKESEIFRLDSDLERVIKKLYYNDEERDFDVKIENEQIEFFKDGSVIQTLTVKRFEEDLEYEPDKFENARQLINLALENERLNDNERTKLAHKLEDLYDELKEQQINEEFEEKAKKKK